MIRRLTLLVLLAVCLAAVPLCASAITEAEWQAECRYITITTATIYDYAYGESVDEQGNAQGTFIAVTSLPAGTYIKVGAARESKRRMSYLSGGGILTGYIDPGTYQAVNAGTDSAPAKVAKPATPWTVTYEGGSAVIKALGTVHTEITVEGETKRVLTSEISWNTEAEENKRIACVNKKSIVSATMRTEMSTKADIIEKVPLGTLVLVEKVGKKYTRVYYDGQTGYILNKYLNYYPVGEEADARVLSFNGHTNGKATIRIRFSSSKKSRMIAELPTGTYVDVVEVRKNWSRVEVAGYRGFVMNTFLSVYNP